MSISTSVTVGTGPCPRHDRLISYRISMEEWEHDTIPCDGAEPLYDAHGDAYGVRCAEIEWSVLLDEIQADPEGRWEEDTLLLVTFHCTVCNAEFSTPMISANDGWLPFDQWETW